jgi:transposase
MTTRNNTYDYAELQALIPTAVPGTLMDCIAKAFGFTGKSGVKRLIIRLRDAGFDMSAYDAAVKARYSQMMTDTQIAALRQGRERRIADLQPKAPKADPSKSKNDHQYALMMQAAATAKPGTLTRTAMELLGVRHESSVRLIRKRLEFQGYDMADWHAVAALGPASHASVRAPRVQHKATPQHRRPAAEAPDYVLRRRTEWLADMRAVAAEPGAIEQLCNRWNCSRDTVYGRIGVLRNAGHDLSWWTPAPSRGFGDADAITAAVETRPLPVVEVQARPSRWAPPIPWTMQAVADVAGVTVLRAMWVGRQHGIPFDTVTLDDAAALGLLSALGFAPKAAA